MKEVRIIAFKGISFVSKVIKRITRGEFSHIGFLMEDDFTTIEAWYKPNQKKWFNRLLPGFRWGISNLNAHTPNTEILILKKNMYNKQYNKLECCLNFVAKEEIPYDWSEIFGYLPILRALEVGKKVNGKRVCSSGTIAYLQFADIIPSEYIKPFRISPTYAVDILLSNGFKPEEAIIRRGENGNNYIERRK